MLNGIDAVIFDLDGTLVDSMWMWKSIDEAYLALHGIDYQESLQPIIEGMSFSETAAYFKKRFQIKDSLDEIKDCWNRMVYDKYMTEVPIKPGGMEFLQLLKKRNIRTGIATSNSVKLAKAVTEKLGITRYIDEIHTSCEVEHGKPEPDIYLLVAEKLRVQPERCLVFEDIMPGILAGKAAGMRVCAVEDDYSITDTMRKREAADYYIYSFCELINA